MENGRKWTALFLITAFAVSTSYAKHHKLANNENNSRRFSKESPAADKLGTYRIDKNSITVSGLSAGGFFAVQVHVAFSKFIKGAGVLAGGPFYCARGSETTALGACMLTPFLISVSSLVKDTRDMASKGEIDDTSNLESTRVYLYSGTGDTVVVQGVMKKLEEYYESFMPSSHIETKFDIPSQHSFVTDDYGNSCSFLGSPYINNCGYEAAAELLAWLYSNSTSNERFERKITADEELITFDQTEFFPGFDTSMDSEGYAYVPTACKSNQTVCRLHFAFHGCKQGRESVQTTFALHAGYNAVAEKINMIVVYPQCKSSLLKNPNGCYDWWGYTGSSYATKTGKQMAGVKAMMDRVAGTTL